MPVQSGLSSSEPRCRQPRDPIDAKRGQRHDAPNSPEASVADAVRAIESDATARKMHEGLAVVQALGDSAEAAAALTSDMVSRRPSPLNLTRAMPYENRTVKSDRAAADYLPEHNQCWFAGRVIAVKQKWGLSVDMREAQFLKTALTGCTPEQNAAPACEASSTTPTANHPPIQTFANCAAMRSAGWSRGVNRDGGTYEDARAAAERATYTLNTARDRYKDGRACEA